nr:peptidyl-prolyl cis-trans isomerase-like 1 [Tanacetum cinerariifolium]
KLEKVATPTPIPRGTAGQHPIDWAVVQGVPVGQRVRLTTTQGSIELELKVVESPGAVASFVTLLTYGAGAVGLASAGKDTESCQFFVTHLPTPHLDGRYPIFAQVVRGLDVAQRLDIGDRITACGRAGAAALCAGLVCYRYPAPHQLAPVAGNGPDGAFLPDGGLRWANGSGR